MAKANERATLQEQANKAKAAELVKEGSYDLYTEGNAQKAYDLAKQALELDPTSKDAKNLEVAAGVVLGKASETVYQAQAGGQRPRPVAAPGRLADLQQLAGQCPQPLRAAQV